jgi:hypothetical protein
MPATSQQPRLTKHILLTLEAAAHRAEYRPKRRKPLEQQRYEYIVNALVCDLAYNHLWGKACRIHLSRRAAVLSRQFRRRYKPDWLTGKMLPKILDTMERAGLLTQEKGQCGPKPVFALYMNQTRISPGPLLRQLIDQYGVTGQDIVADYTGQEIVVLKGEKDDYFTEADLQDYEDSPDTVKFRNEVRTINAWLRDAQVSLRPFQGMPVPSVDLRERHLRRYFTRSSFKSGGRLFGGFWQNMSKRERLCCVLLNGEEVVEKDYSAVVPRLLYGMAGVSVPSPLLNDLYRIPGFERSRPGIKKLFNALLFDTPKTVRKGFPADSKQLFDREELSKVGGMVGPVIEAIKSAHSPVAEHFGTGIGHRLMFMESQVLVAVLLELQHRNATALPIHDAVLTSQRDDSVVERVMLETFERMSGKAGKVETVTYRNL